ncbi:MAG: type II toxin-antitoxin system prevent-host-death family antitoxin [Acidobacteria bacterium]|nr:type II toxin-antitoxin system prevent-host-death family antitoxin [Acidobacteriota bacterium]
MPSLVREAESGEAVELTRRGEPVAVLIGRRQYARMIAKRRRFSDALAAFVQDFDLVALEINPEEVFSGARDQTGGREIRL